jgi:DNA helicase II / ATP-dependent DNA helicase PcrA
MTFTEEQKKIFHFVQYGQNNGIIDAVAGAGKTTTIMECAKFVKDKKEVLFCAFNNSIASEISRKFREKGMHDVTVKTIHALGFQMLRANNNFGKQFEIKERKYYELLHSEEMKARLQYFYQKILRLNNLEPENTWNNNQKYAINNLTFRINNRLLGIIQKSRSTLMQDDILKFEELVTHFGIFNAIEIKNKNFRQELVLYFECYKILLAAGNEFSRRSMVIDFTDMIYLPYEWKLQSTERFKFLFVDECQDLSKAQLATVLKFGHKEGRILSVGDPWQSIYGFTGADIESFGEIKNFTKATQLPLTACFRCPQQIIALAKQIRTDITGIKNENGVVANIQFNEVINYANPDDLIISRLRAPLLLMVFKFIDKNIKVNIHEDEAKEILDEMKNLFKQEETGINILNYPGGFAKIKESVLKRRKFIIEKEAERIIDSMERQMHSLNETYYLEQKLDFLQQRYEVWKGECSTIASILDKIKNFITATKDAVKLSTIHRAKGLENDRVFILNYNELPFQRLEQKAWEKVQELNLKYVALTRTKNELFLVQSAKQTLQAHEDSLFDIFSL